MYATAPSGRTVLKYSPTGQLIAQKSKQNAAILQTPTGLTVLPDGTVIVVDTNQNGVVNLGTIP